MVCTDERVRMYIPILSSWLADHMQNVIIHGIKTTRCPICVVSTSQLLMLPQSLYNHRDHGDYETLYPAGDSDRYANCAICLKHR